VKQKRQRRARFYRKSKTTRDLLKTISKFRKQMAKESSLLSIQISFLDELLQRVRQKDRRMAQGINQGGFNTGWHS
jgi:hypothetical protein